MNAIRRLFKAAKEFLISMLAMLRKATHVDAMARLTKASKGLLFSSESDYPLEPFQWTDPAPFTPDALYKLAGLPQSTSVAQDTVANFFAPMTSVPPGATPESRKRAARFKKLVALIQQVLSDPVVYKLGSVEMPTFIVGRLPDGTVAGLRTTVVET